MGVLYYLALVLGLFGGCWVLVGENTARWLFITVHSACVSSVLLLYIKETLAPRLTTPRTVETATVSHHRRS
ncbi:MAG: hypothetical protein FJ147_20200 [Deltaproteobacteria bacterium]|nr:hypothetical protein [Deltaproteobacteria bacterium]